MRILWTVNTFNQSIAREMGMDSSHSISWVEAMSDYLSKNEHVSLAIAAPCSFNMIRKKEIKGIVYYAVPYNEKSWYEVIKDFNPEIIHEYGTEKAHNLIVFNVSNNIPIVVSLQGILSEYQRHYYGGIDISTILKYSPLRDWIRPSGFITGRRDFKKRAKKEIELLKKASYVEGRSTWDKVASFRINSKLKYFYCPRMLRRPFNESIPWNIDTMEKHTILISQGNYPIKGVHFVFEAIAYLKKEYPDIKLIITGNNMFLNMKKHKKWMKTGYARYLFDLATKLNIMENIYFAGTKDAEAMLELLKRVHIAVISSSIENAPNSLAEAMLVGTPCIASFVGGNMDMMKHNEEGFLYCYNEPYMLAYYIRKIFESNELAIKFSNNSRKTAKKRHDPNYLVTNLLQIYNDIVWDFKKNIE